MEFYPRGVSAASFSGSSPPRGWKGEDTGNEVEVSRILYQFAHVWKILENIGSQQTTYKKQLLTSAFDFTAVFADKVVSISEAAQRAERLARLAGSVVVKRLISTLHHAR